MDEGRWRRMEFVNQRVPAMAPKSKSQFKGSCRVWIAMHTKRGNHDWEWSWCSSSWRFQAIWKILVKLDHFFRDRGEHKKYLSCHHLVMVPGNDEGRMTRSFFPRIPQPRQWLLNSCSVACTNTSSVPSKMCQCAKWQGHVRGTWGSGNAYLLD